MIYVNNNPSYKVKPFRNNRKKRNDDLRASISYYLSRYVLSYTSKGGQIAIRHRYINFGYRVITIKHALFYKDISILKNLMNLSPKNRSLLLRDILAAEFSIDVKNKSVILRE